MRETIKLLTMRVKVFINSPVLFEASIEVRIDDINYGNHLGNDRVLSIAHEARMRFFKSLGYKSEVDFGDSLGIIVTDAAIEYVSEAFHGDLLIVKISIDDVSTRGMDIYHELVQEKSGKIVSRVKTGILFFNYQERKVGKIPGEFLKRLAKR